MAWYHSSAGITSGDILITQDQYERLATAHPAFEGLQAEFVPVPARGCTMYRYKDAINPWKPPTIDVSQLNLNDEYDWFKYCVHNFIQALNENYSANLVEADEDEEFTSGAFTTALATCFRKEDDWQIEPMIGSMWEIRKV